MALTKVQKEFFTKFTKTAVQNLLIGAAAPQYATEVQKAAEEALESIDVSSLTEGIGKAFLDKVDFTKVKRVNKFLESDDYREVALASAEALTEVEELLADVLRSVADKVSEVVVPEEAA